LDYKDKILYYIDKLSLLREDYVEAHRTIKAKYNYDYRDARVAVFTKCTITMNTAFVGFILIREELLDPLWWKEHISELDDTAITGQIEDFEMTIRSTFLSRFFASIESSFRYYCRYVSPGACNNAAGNFKNIYEHLLSKNKFNLPNYMPLLDLWRNMRNTIHNNGKFYPENQQDCEVPYKEVTYKFEVGKVPQFLTWDLLLNLIPDVKDMLLSVVNSNDLTRLTRSILE
jgi:hypothetical protein